MLALANLRLNAGCSEGFSHTFLSGQITVVLGANNAGKTDMCRFITGLSTPARGEILLDGEEVSRMSPQQRSVSLVYQAFVNYPNLTVLENIESPLRARNAPAAARLTQASDIAAKLQLTELLHRLPHELSGGQQQRVAIARALAKGARVLLLDEPLVNLDFKLREALENELRELLTASNTIVIYTSSDPRDAFTLGDQLLLLDNGRKLQSGSPVDVYRNPNCLRSMELLADPFVNRFLGDGSECAIRPEHVRVDDKDHSQASITFEMQVTAFETSGDESFIHGQVADHDWIARCQGMKEITVGSKLALHVREQDIVRF